jgi:hypothetical protein
MKVTLRIRINRRETLERRDQPGKAPASLNLVQGRKTPKTLPIINSGSSPTLPGSPLSCPRCGSLYMRESRRWPIVKAVLGVLGLRAYRCHTCCRRFYSAALDSAGGAVFPRGYWRGQREITPNRSPSPKTGDPPGLLTLGKPHRIRPGGGRGLELPHQFAVSHRHYDDRTLLLGGSEGVAAVRG